MKYKEYNRNMVLEYAKKWAYGRNPKFYNYDPVGGDCTNFISQCIYAGSNIMNYDKQNGWYYINGNDKSPSWTGVEFLYKFLTTNKSIGPYGKETSIEKLELGDIIQLSFNGATFGHSLVVVNKDESSIYVAAHTFNTYNRELSTYSYEKIRTISIEGVRIW